MSLEGTEFESVMSDTEALERLEELHERALGKKVPTIRVKPNLYLGMRGSSQFKELTLPLGTELAVRLIGAEAQNHAAWVGRHLDIQVHEGLVEDVRRGIGQWFYHIGHHKMLVSVGLTDKK